MIIVIHWLAVTVYHHLIMLSSLMHL